MSRTRNLQYMDYTQNYEKLADQLIKWSELKPENKEIQDMITNLTRIAFYVANLSMEVEDLEAALRYEKTEKLNSIEKLRNEMYVKANLTERQNYK